MMSTEFPPYFTHFKLDSHFLGVFPIDKIPPVNKIPVRSFLIFNLSEHTEIGTHWASIVRPSKTHLELFDPLSVNFDLVRSYLKLVPKKIEFDYNLSAFQMKTSSTCGQFNIYFLIERVFNFDLSLKDLLIDIFEPELIENEQRVKKFCSDIKKTFTLQT